MKRLGGRPTKYKPEYCDQIIAYFSVKPYEQIWTQTEYQNGSVKSKLTITANPLPTMAEFAHSIGVNGDTLVEWAKDRNKEKYPGFSAAYIRAKELYRKILIINGLHGFYNARLAKLLYLNTTNIGRL